MGWLRQLLTGGRAETVAPPEGPQKWLPLIQRDYCNGCACCTDACPVDALELVWSFATLVGADVCDSCGACESACPEKLIGMRWLPGAGDPAVGEWQAPEPEPDDA